MRGQVKSATVQVPNTLRHTRSYREANPRRPRSRHSAGARTCVGADAQGRRAGRRDHHLPPGSPPVHRQADRAAAELRRPGRHRHREHAAAQRAAPAHRRSDRGAGAADDNRGNSGGHQQLASATRSRCSTPSCRAGSDSFRAPPSASRSSRTAWSRRPPSPNAIRVRAELWRQRFPFPLTREYMHSVAILDRKMLDIPDVEDAPAEMEVGRKNFLGSGYRAATFVPLMRGETAIGALSVVRVTTGPLSDKQLAALKTYANQAVIAIENTRLLNELRQRTDDLTESLEQQTATAEVLRVISSSPGELEPVFEAMLENATRICEAKFGILLRLRRRAASAWPRMHDAPPAYAEDRRREPFMRPTPVAPLGTRVATKAGGPHRRHVPRTRLQRSVDRSSCRTRRRANASRRADAQGQELIGAIIIYRQEVRPFTDKQIELVQNFAAQAVIAIENTRLLNELRRIAGAADGDGGRAARHQLVARRAASRCSRPCWRMRRASATPNSAICCCTTAMISRWRRCTTRRRHRPRSVAATRYSSRSRTPLSAVLVATKQVVHIADRRADPGYVSGDPAWSARRWLAHARFSLCRCSRTMNWSAQSPSIARRSARSPTSRSSWCRISPPRPSSPSRTRGCSTNCGRRSLEQQTATADVLKVISRSTWRSAAGVRDMLENRRAALRREIRRHCSA